MQCVVKRSHLLFRVTSLLDFKMLNVPKNAKVAFTVLLRDVTSVLSVQMVVKGKLQGKLLLQNIYMYVILTTIWISEMKFQAKSHVIET